MHSKPNEQFFPKKVVIQLSLFETDATSTVYLYSILNYKTNQIRKHNGQLLFKTLYARTKQHVTLRSHNRSTALDQIEIDYLGARAGFICPLLLQWVCAWIIDTKFITGHSRSFLWEFKINSSDFIPFTYGLKYKRGRLVLKSCLSPVLHYFDISFLTEDFYGTWCITCKMMIWQLFD